MTNRDRDHSIRGPIQPPAPTPTPIPTMSPLNLNLQERSAAAAGTGGTGGGETWRHFDNSVNAVSFGFVATAILISMFLVMAIFERFLRPTSSFFSATGNGNGNGNGPRRRRPSSASSPTAVDPEAHPRNFARKLEDYPSPKMSIYAKGVSVLMPGYDIPTFIAHPVPPPAPCPPERIMWPPHNPIPIAGSPLSSS